MRGPTTRATAASRTTRHQVMLMANRAPPGIPPRAQQPSALRAAQAASGQQPVDLERIGIYHEHWCLLSTKQRPSRPARTCGRVAARPRHGHALVADEKRQPRSAARATSSRSVTQTCLPVVSNGVVQHLAMAYRRMWGILATLLDRRGRVTAGQPRAGAGSVFDRRGGSPVRMPVPPAAVRRPVHPRLPAEGRPAARRC